MTDKLTKYDVPDAIFPSNNITEIPVLKLEKQAQYAIAPFLAWGSVKRKGIIMRGTWHFYTDDYRFEKIWKDPQDVINTECVACVEPNFSCYSDMPIPVGLYHIYRKRWIARYWQENGIKIFVDLNVNDKYYKINFLGVPKGWRAYCTKGYAKRVDDINIEYELACEWAGNNDILFVVVGGGEKVRELRREIPFVYIEEYMRIQETQKRLPQTMNHQLSLFL